MQYDVRYDTVFQHQNIVYIIGSQNLILVCNDSFYKILSSFEAYFPWYVNISLFIGFGPENYMGGKKHSHFKG